MARYCPLFSGSEGNCTYIGNADAGILIDAGVSAKRMEEAMTRRGIDPRRITALFVTHEHGDHVLGLKVFAKRYRLPVYATPGTIAALIDKNYLDPATRCREIQPGGPGVEAGGCLVTAFATPHDSRQSCGYRIATPDGRQVAVATDMGHMTDVVRRAITGCDLVHIESNHDLEMLKAGPYPYPLKQRILGSHGHLCNDACGAELFGLARGGTTRFVLAHLSRQNNLPDLAYRTARSVLSGNGLLEGADYILRVAAPEDAYGVMIF